MSLLDSISTAAHSVVGRAGPTVGRPSDAAGVGGVRSPAPDGLPRLVIERESSDAVEQLLLAVASGNHDALVALRSLVGGLVRANIRRVLLDASCSDAVTQEFFAEVLREATDFDPGRNSAEAWLLTRAHQRAMRGLTAAHLAEHAGGEGHRAGAAAATP